MRKKVARSPPFGSFQTYRGVGLFEPSRFPSRKAAETAFMFTFRAGSGRKEISPGALWPLGFRRITAP